jgi:FkbM family methyltransferase
LDVALIAGEKNIVHEASMNSGQISPVKKPAPLRQRLGRWKQAIKFAWAGGGSAKDCGRLFYHAGLKPSLVFHGFSRYSPEQILSFSLRANDGKTFQIFARDNGLDVGTFSEFFQPWYAMIPSELPPLKPKIIYDFGANIGAASLYFATMYPEARLYGFEPLPFNYEVCVLNYRNLPSSRAFPWAVGARSETATFECNNDPRGGRLTGSVVDPRLKLTERIDVQILSVADLIQVKKLEPPEFLKIDVEGAEMEVLKGMEGYTHSVRRMFVETHSPELTAGCLKWMQEHGFRIYGSHDPTALWGDRV